MPETVQLPWGREILSFPLPETWRIAGVFEPSQAAPLGDPRKEVQRALAQPVGCLPLNELCQQIGPDRPVVVVMDDISRPTPVSTIFPEVLAELERGCVTRENITLVTALGLHRPMAAEEIFRRAGVEPGTLAVENPECDNEEKQVFLGTTSRGTPVWLNKTVAEASLVILIGCIDPHIIASFGGGYKNLVPGVAGRKTIAHNHSLNCTPGTFNMVGQPIEHNPMRLDMEEAAAMLKPQVFIINAILDHCQQVVKITAGDPVAAHRVGVATSAGMYGVKVARHADVVITGSAPMDSDFRQGVKALANTVRAVKPGGVMITFARAEDGVGVFGLANRKLPVGRGGLQLLAPLLLKAVPNMKLSGMGEEDRFFLYFALQAMRRARLLMYAPTIPAATQENLPFLQFAPSVDAALRMARQSAKKNAEVLVFPHGGITYPELAGS